MAATLKQIAALTGLSIPTVHQILNKYDAPFAEATRKRVLAVAAELDYRPNITARSLVTQRSFLVAVLFYGANYDLVTPFMRGVQATVTTHGCSPIFLTHGTPAEEADHLRGVMERRVDGLIVNLAVDPQGTSNADRLAEVHAGGLPMTEVFGQFVPGVAKVSLDYRAAAAAATERLVAEGHKRIALLIRENYHEAGLHTVGRRFWIATEFWRGYDGVMRSAGLEPNIQEYAVAADNTRENAHFVGAAHAVPALFADPATAPTAVVCYSVEAAEATVRRYERLPLDRPLTVAAFGMIRPAVSERIRILSLPLPAERAGRLAAEAIFEQMAGRPVADAALGPEMTTEPDPSASAA
jgi:DNA-binding LacI/PurR family transcriptional regulator